MHIYVLVFQIMSVSPLIVCEVEVNFLMMTNFLFLTVRWDDELIQFMTSLVKDEHVALFFRSVASSLRLYWRSVWKTWRIAALPYGTFDSLNVNTS